MVWFVVIFCEDSLSMMIHCRFGNKSSDLDPTIQEFTHCTWWFWNISSDFDSTSDCLHTNNASEGKIRKGWPDVDPPLCILGQFLVIWYENSLSIITNCRFSSMFDRESVVYYLNLSFMCEIETPISDFGSKSRVYISNLWFHSRIIYSQLNLCTNQMFATWICDFGYAQSIQSWIV